MGDDQRRLVVFDLDACCWYPEMYMLWGGGAPFKQCGTAPNNTLTDVQNTTCRLLGDVAASWAELHRRVSAGEPIVVGIASRSDEPAWARECLHAPLHLFLLLAFISYHFARSRLPVPNNSKAIKAKS